MRHAFALASILLASLGSAADARSCRGVDFPEHVQVDGSELALNGLGVRKATFLKVNVYVAALYVPRASTDPAALIHSQGPEEIVLHFVRDVGVGALRKGWSEGFERSAAGRLPSLQARIATLNGWMSEVRAGQRLTFVRRPGTGIQVSVNGAMKGSIEGDDFAQAFISIWLGASPPNGELKAGLLGGACE
ncbi:MAG TPA: chalcone isomerase family protein [Steroidobacteraceae bacterium]